MSLPRYSEYKDSGVEWLGEVPRNWDVLALSRVLAAAITDGPHTTPVFVDDGIPFLSVDGIQDGELVFDGCRYVSADDHYEFSKKAKPARNDILMGKAASIGKIARVKTDLEFSIWSPLALIRPNVTACIPIFLEYTLKSKWLQAQIETLANSNTQLNIGMKDIPKLRLCLPPITEQTAIATFLDRETAKIDGLIAEQEKLIALLAEKRQATISHAVTKGLNPAAPMKDSGVAWLGEVPAHWNIAPLGNICCLIQTGPFGSQLHAEDYIEDGTPVVNPSNLVDGQIVPDWKCSVAAEMVNNLPQHVLRIGDIVFGRRGEMGRCALVKPENAGWLCGTGSINLRLKTDNPKFVVTYLGTTIVRELLKLESVGSTMDNLNAGILSKIRVPLPPSVEKQQITTFLDTETARLDTLTTEATHGIALLKERRAALISAAVTGKIDVRAADNQ